MRGRASKIKRIHQCKQDGRNRRHALEVEEEAHAPPPAQAQEDASALQVDGRQDGLARIVSVAHVLRAQGCPDVVITEG